MSSDQQDFHDGENKIYEEYEHTDLDQGQHQESEVDHSQAHDENQPASPNTSVYVENLPRDVQELELRQIFSNFGFIEHVKIARKPNGHILGYAFIHFKTVDDSTKAVAGLNNYQLRDKNIRVRFAQPKKNPEEKKPPQKCNLYISGIPESCTSDMLKQRFQAFGNVIKSNILMDKMTQRPKGVGFIVFESQDQADAAIAGMNGQVLVEGAMPLVVKHAQDERERMQMRNQGYQSGGPSGYGPHRGQRMHSQNRFNPMGGPRGNYGSRGSYPRQQYQQNYNSYQQPSSSSSSYDQGYAPQQNNYQQSSYRQPQNLPPQALSGTTLFVFHIPSGCTESDLSGLFGLYGSVAHVHIPREHQGGNKGYAFVTMSLAKDAENAIQYLNGYQMGDKYLKISLKNQQPQQQQQQQSAPQQQYGYSNSQQYYSQQPRY